MIIGLTGGIASGKSTVSKVLSTLGAKIIDADLKAKEISEKDETIKEIEKTFGKDIIGELGKIDREKLKNIVFSDKEKLKKLNNIIHPKVISEFKKIKENANKNDIIIFDVPLLFESKMDKMCDKVILIIADEPTQIKRMIERDGITEVLAKKIIDSQMGLDEKIKKSDILIENNGGLLELNEKIKEIYKNLKS